MQRLGSGSFGTVYRLSKTKVIKVYNRFAYYSKSQDGNIMAEEVELSMCSEHALPVLEVAVATKGDECFYAVIKRYLPNTATYKDSDRLRSLLPWDLRADCYSANVRKDSKGRAYLIDTQGKYAFELI